MKRRLIMVTRRQEEQGQDEFHRDWGFPEQNEAHQSLCPVFQYSGTTNVKDKKIEYFKKTVSPRELIVIRGCGLPPLTQISKSIKQIHKYLEDSGFMPLIKKLVVDGGQASECKTIIATHGFGEADNFIEESKKYIDNKLISEHLKVIKNFSFVSYTIGGDVGRIGPEIKNMAKCLTDSGQRFNEAFDALWGAVLGIHAVFFLLSQLLACLKINLCDLGNKPDDLDDIIASIYYLCTGEKNSGKLVNEVENAFPESDKNLKNIMGYYEWGKEAKKSLDTCLEKLKRICRKNNHSNHEEPRDFLIKFQVFVQNICMGKKPDGTAC